MYIKRINNSSWYNGTYYYKDSNHTILHREDGPAIEFANKTKHWYLNGKYHREDGPAIEYFNEGKRWYLNGERHREDGPAIIYDDGSKAYYLNHKWFSKNEYIQYINQNTICPVKKAKILKQCT